MPEAARHVEYRAEELEEAIDPRIPELKQKLVRLYKAQDGILVDAGNRVLTKAEKKAIMKWMKKRGSEEEWPLDDNITLENYQARYAPYGIADLIDTRHITGKNDIYNLVTRQYNAFSEELQRLKEQPKRFRVIAGQPAAPHATPLVSQPAEVSPQIAQAQETSSQPNDDVVKEEVIEDKQHGENEPEKKETTKKATAMSWKVWEMIFALLHSMQKYPEQFEELKQLSPDALNKKLTEEGPRLVREYMNIASRGAMEWDKEQKMWDVSDQTKLANMDVKVGLLVLERAGFKVEVTPERLQLVPPGNEAAAKPFVLQFDTMDTEKRKRMEEAVKGGPRESMYIESAESLDTDLKPGEYRITVDHHTDDPRERKTSGAQLLYDYFLAAGMGDFKDQKRDPVLERLLAFTNADDNGEFPADRDFYLRSASTLWGIGSDSRVPASVLYNIMARGRKPEDQLAEEDLSEAINEGLTVRELVANKEKQIGKDAKEFDRWSREGYVIDSDYGPLYVCVETEGRYMPKQRAAKAYGGVPNVLIWSPEKHSFFIALGGGKTFRKEIKFPQEGTRIIRRHLAIFKRQARTPQELTAVLTDILTPLSKKERWLRGDLKAYVERIIGPDTSNETLFSIYTKAPEKQDAVIEELVQYPKRLPAIKRSIAVTRGETQRIYKEMFDRAQQKLKPPSPAGGPPQEPPPPPSPQEPYSSPAPEVPVTEEPEIEQVSKLRAEYSAQKATEAKKKKAKRKKRPSGADLRMDDTGEDLEG